MTPIKEIITDTMPDVILAGLKNEPLKYPGPEFDKMQRMLDKGLIKPTIQSGDRFTRFEHEFVVVAVQYPHIITHTTEVLTGQDNFIYPGAQIQFQGAILKYTNSIDKYYTWQFFGVAPDVSANVAKAQVQQHRNRFKATRTHTGKRKDQKKVKGGRK